MKPINIDMDGVIADFDLMIYELFGADGLDGEGNEEEFWNELVYFQDPFEDMKPIQEGLDMVGLLIDAGCKIRFLTGTGGGKFHVNIAQQKLAWLLDQGFGEHPVAFATSTECKANYACAGSILIDDRDKVLDAWREAGGIGIKFEPGRGLRVLDEISKLAKLA